MRELPESGVADSDGNDGINNPVFVMGQALAVGFLMDKYGLTEVSFTLDEAPDGPAALTFDGHRITITKLPEEGRTN